MSESKPNILFESHTFHVTRETLRLEDGRELTRDIVRHPGAAVILPILEDGRICLIENFRISAGEWLLELPAGTLEPNEEPLVAASRELTEETGYQAERIEPLLSFFSSPGMFDEQMHVFLATGLTPGKMDLQDGEQIRVRPMPLEEILKLIQAGQIHDGKTIASVLYYWYSEKNTCCR